MIALTWFASKRNQIIIKILYLKDILGIYYGIKVVIQCQIVDITLSQYIVIRIAIRPCLSQYIAIHFLVAILIPSLYTADLYNCGLIKCKNSCYVVTGASHPIKMRSNCPPPLFRNWCFTPHFQKITHFALMIFLGLKPVCSPYIFMSKNIHGRTREPARSGTEGATRIP